jgi:PAS domain S-box-containing protein
VGLYDFQTGLALVVSCWVVSWEMGIFWMSRQFQDIELVLSEREIELSKQADLLNLTQDAIIVRDLEGKIIFWNNGANEMYGYSPEEVKGTISHELLKTKFPTDKNAIQEMILKNSKWEGELTHFTKGNQPVVVSSRWSLKRDRAGNAVEILEINNDISATKEVEERVSEFYSTVSHELRTPLTSIKGSFSLLAGGKVGELSSKGDQLVKIGLAETERLIRLINDILDIKKIEVGKFQLYVENIAPQEFIKQTILSVLGFAEQYGVNLIAEIKNNDTIEGDKDRLIQVLTNLISNAVKFSDPGEAVTIVSSKRDKYIRFSVIDKGPGIDARNVPKLFRMFQQSDSGTAQPKGGSGLGLAVCKSLVEQHGGNIGIDTEVGKGSTFWFEIPCV